ncbi:hypothetical protein [Desulfofustis limnaeus]|uniref:Uncharacterized protein n=1 Tax=Desulfofustis limnaeus TaxID=2740163 RepID=A0ABM7W6J2_9BACT|nr:hypothetical protein [Desulfofustis limnaeus]BDD86577.1 hypothetical protein DPPLL_09420 [Desulfofustis limnaeus]
MVIIVSTLLKHFMVWRCDQRFLDNLDRITIGLAKGSAYAMITYLVIKLVAVAHDQEWQYLITGWGAYYLLELGIGVVLPMLLFAWGVHHQRPAILRFGAAVAVAGIIWNRLNTVLVTYNWQTYQEIPTWQETWIVFTVLAFYFIVYRFVLYRLPVVFSWKQA